MNQSAAPPDRRTTRSTPSPPRPARIREPCDDEIANEAPDPFAAHPRGRAVGGAVVHEPLCGASEPAHDAQRAGAADARPPVAERPDAPRHRLVVERAVDGVVEV